MLVRVHRSLSPSKVVYEERTRCRIIGHAAVLNCHLTTRGKSLPVGANEGTGLASGRTDHDAHVIEFNLSATFRKRPRGLRGIGLHKQDRGIGSLRVVAQEIGGLVGLHST